MTITTRSKVAVTLRYILPKQRSTNGIRRKQGNVAARRTWRKLHLAVDENHQVLACELTTPKTGDNQRNSHIRMINQNARITWQKQTGYGLRNYAELVMQRYKRIFGNTMKARKLPQKKAEVWISAVALNRMIGLGCLYP